MSELVLYEVVAIALGVSGTLVSALAAWVRNVVKQQQARFESQFEQERAEHERQKHEWEQLRQQQRESFQLKLLQQEKMIESELQEAKNENLQQRAIADSIYAQIHMNSASMSVIQTLADAVKLANDYESEMREQLQVAIAHIYTAKVKIEDLIRKTEEQTNERKADNHTHTEDRAESANGATISTHGGSALDGE